ncbi:hypothetical protein CANMA_002481 [Candida margitis]|uniref:uncharacterized protein n=1 Tax=Candida margitis TaxID=1775924 RepID=UPI002226746D|nr:uncharacterized protein CANMA_002481 [Candida margitis]KAI5968265.1 hypothetical protein CANMA_002481 [Candida margitis]
MVPPPPFRPYGGDDYRIVSDLSRFEYNNGNKLPRLRRSRNTTPTNSDFTEIESSTSSTAKLTIDGFLPFYASQVDNDYNNNESGSYYGSLQSKDFSVQGEESFSHPLPIRREQQVSIGVQVPQDNAFLRPPPQVPPKDIPTRTQSQREFLPYPPSIFESNDTPPYDNNALPPLPQPQPQLQPRGEKMYAKVTQFDNGDNDSLMSRQKNLEHDLIKSVMNQPLISFKTGKLGDRYYGRKITITVNLILYLFEICCSIIEIVLSSVLLQQDSSITVGVYRYFIADGVITIIVALLFTMQIVTYEKRNGSFYCTAAVVFKLISFIMIIAYIFPYNHKQTQRVWSIRRALGAFIIISTFVWICNLVMFLTTLYISRLNLLEDLNFDFDQRGLNDEFNVKAGDYRRGDNDGDKDRLKAFYLNENGEMYALHDNEEREKYSKNNKILVYTF